jgi:hypothetical protein
VDTIAKLRIKKGLERYTNCAAAGVLVAKKCFTHFTSKYYYSRASDVE